MKIIGVKPTLSNEKLRQTQTISFQKEMAFRRDAYIPAVQQSGIYTNYSKPEEGSTVGERKVIAVTPEQFEALMSGEFGEVQKDGDRYWIRIGDKCYEFRKPKEEEEEKKSTHDMLLDTVEECLERTQDQLDETFYDWTMKKDLLYPNIGKKGIITLEDVLKKHEEKKEKLEREQDKKENF